MVLCFLERIEHTRKGLQCDDPYYNAWKRREKSQNPCIHVKNVLWYLEIHRNRQKSGRKFTLLSIVDVIEYIL